MIRDEMVAAYRRGWTIIPLKKGDKTPNLPVGHDFLSRKPTNEEYRKFKFHNYGIVCGPLSGICVLDIDLDSGGMETLVEQGLYDSVFDTYTPRVNTPGGHHFYFSYSPDVRTGANVIGKGVDVRSIGGYVVGVGSVVNGKEYKWQDGYGPDVTLEEPPSWLRRGKSRRLTDDNWKMPEKVREGGRNSKLASLAGALLLRDIPYRIMVETMQHINTIWFDPPLDEQEVITIADSIERNRNADKT